MYDFAGWIIGIAVAVFCVCVVSLALRIDHPCTANNTSLRMELIEAHERCKVEENCVYGDRDIRRYDRRVAQQKACKLQDAE